VNFEDVRLASDLTFELLDAIVEFAHARTSGSRPHYVFFDEIHHVAGWEKWLHTKLERPGRDHFALTGSNAALLAGEFSTALTGRHRTIELFPFDIRELRALKPESTLEQYLAGGGFPRVLTYGEPQDLLREYFTDMLERDVRGRVLVRSTAVLTQLVKAVFESMGSEVSARSLAGLLGVTADTVGSYLDGCIAAYILLPCAYFTFSERQRTARHRKLYPIDVALRDAVVTKTGLDLGKRLEAAVFLHLRRTHREVCFWRGKGEIDFVVQDHDGITPVQVSWDGPKERHDRAEAEFRKAFPQARPLIFVSRENAEAFLSAESV
jgi:predicted AAA+ superfamily ATPase